MISALIASYCIFAAKYDICTKELYQCIQDLNQYKYESSQWLDVPDEKMSVESFKECME